MKVPPLSGSVVESVPTVVPDGLFSSTLLEESDVSVEEVARLVGFGTAAGLREQFQRRRGVSPRAYRQTFRAGARSGAGAVPVQLDRHRGSRVGIGAGGVGSDQPLVEAQFGQPA